MPILGQLHIKARVIVDPEREESTVAGSRWTGPTKRMPVLELLEDTFPVFDLSSLLRGHDHLCVFGQIGTNFFNGGILLCLRHFLPKFPFRMQRKLQRLDAYNMWLPGARSDGVVDLGTAIRCSTSSSPAVNEKIGFCDRRETNKIEIDTRTKVK